MREKYPHDLKHFPDGEIPEGFIPLTDEQAREVNPKLPDERAEWLKKLRDARTD